MAVASLGNFTSAAGQTYTFSVFQESFVVDLNISSTSIAGLYLFGSLTAAVLIIFVGRYLDLFGPRVMFVFVTMCLGSGAFWLIVVTAPNKYLLLCFYCLPQNACASQVRGVWLPISVFI